MTYKPWGTPKTPKVMQDHCFCGSDCGLDLTPCEWQMTRKRTSVGAHCGEDYPIRGLLANHLDTLNLTRKNQGFT